MGFQYNPNSWLQNMLPSGNKMLEGTGEENRVVGFEIVSRKYWDFFKSSHFYLCSDRKVLLSLTNLKHIKSFTRTSVQEGRGRR